MVGHLQNIVSEWRTAAAAAEPVLGPRFKRLACVLFALVTVYIVAAIVLVPSTQEREFNFVDERGAITVLSAIFMSMGCGFAFAAFWVSLGATTAVRRFWLLVSAGIGFFVLDELLQFHERIGNRINELDPFGLYSSEAIRGWDDVIVIMYGVVALPVGVILLRTIVKFPTFLKLIAAAFLFYVVHTAIDSLTEPRTTLSVICEESCKLYSTLLIALACLSGLLVQAGKAPATDDA